MKTILISIPFGMSARNFLRSDVFRILKQHTNVIIVSPLGENKAFLEEFSAPNVKITHIPHSQTLLRAVVSRVYFLLETYWFTKKTKLFTLQFVANILRSTEPIRYWFTVFMGETIGRLGFFRRFLSVLFFKSIWNSKVESLLNENSIDLVFLTHGFVALEMELASQAKARNIKVVNMIHSWDNLTSKSGIRQMTNNQVGSMIPIHLFDRVIVWNEVLQNELIDFYHYPKERIFMSGVPQFDSYINKGQFSGRSEYLKKMGADPAKKTIFFITTRSTLIHDQLTVVKGLIKALRDGRLGSDCQMLIRTHPGSDMSTWADLLKGPLTYFQKPTSSFMPAEIKTWEGKEDNPLMLAEAIYHCDVLINGMSTTAIEAAVFDKPCICLGYDGDLEHNSWIPLYYKTSHYEKIVRTGGLRIAWGEEELLNQIKMYMKDPSLDKEGRELIRQQQCYRVDGKSGQRIAEYLLKEMDVTL